MNRELFKEFESLRDRGLKKKASIAINDFIESFENDLEKEEWTKDYLNLYSEGNNGKIRHELFDRVIFPVLLKGYKERDLWSYMMLIKFIQNIYQAHELHKKLDQKSDHTLLKECVALFPEADEPKLKLLQAQIRWFEHCEHEWPSGILYGMNGATPPQLEEILSEISHARKLDKSDRYCEYLDRFEDRVHEYKKKLIKP